MKTPRTRTPKPPTNPCSHNVNPKSTAKRIKIQFDFVPTASQQEIYDSVFTYGNKYIIANLSRQQGKTTIIKAIVCQWFFTRGEKIGYVTPTKTLAKIIYEELKQQLSSVISKSDGVYHTLTNGWTGSHLSFFSAEQADAIRGQTFDYLIIDEAAFMKSDPENDIWYNVLWPTVKVKGKKIVMISTPRGKNGFFYDYAVRALQGEKKFKYIKRTIYDDGLITKEEIEALKKNYPPLAWKQEYMCEFLDNAISAIPDFEKAFKQFTYDNDRPQWIGIDLSANGEDNTIVTWINDIGQVRQRQIDGELDVKYKLIADCINSTKNLEKVYVEQNGIGAPMLNEIMKRVNNRSKVKYWTTTNETKTDIINLLSMKVSNDEMYLPEEDKKLYGEFCTFTFQVTKTKKVTYGAKTGFHDDRIMSLAIALIAREENKNRFNVSRDVAFCPIPKRKSYL